VCFINKTLQGFDDRGEGMPKEATENQHPPAHHPLDARYYSVVDEPQLS